MDMEGALSLPDKVYLTEVGLRDGLQMEPKVVPTDLKQQLIAGLADAGLPFIQVASFVHPLKIPQMADAERLIAGLPQHPLVCYSALTLNRKGVQRACATNIPWIEVSISASDAHSRQNAGLSLAQARAEVREMVELALAARRGVRASIQCVFGFTKAGDTSIQTVERLATLLVDGGVRMLSLADTSGMATPPMVRSVLDAVLPVAGDVPVGLHLHDTRGLGLVNVLTALEMGIVHFDTSLGGLGGCPFVPGAAGNIATEDTLHLLHSLNIATGIDMARVARCSRKLSAFFERSLPGRLYRLV